MFTNYLIITLRNIIRNKLYFLINVFGLAAGIACCIVISLYVLNELSYDKFHTKAERIYRVKYSLNISEVLYREASIPFPAAEAFINDFPEVEKVVRVYKNADFPLIEYGDSKYIEEEFYFADENFFSVFDFEFIKGNPAAALSEPDNIILTRRTAEKYFGNIDPVGKLIKYNSGTSFKVTGIVENPPANSHFSFDFIASLDYQLNLWKSLTGMEGREKKWYWTGAWTYLLLKENHSLEFFNSKLPDFVDKYFPDKIKKGVELELQPLLDIHLHSDLDNEIAPTGSVVNVYIFSVIAFFILLAACINFINLSTAQSFKRIKEIGMRKVLGAHKVHLVIQILSETVIVTFIAAIVSLAFLEIFLPNFNEIFGLHLELNVFKTWSFTAVLGTLIFLVGLLSGIYPALFILQFSPQDVLKRTINFKAGKDIFRRVLVVVQFFISISLMISIGIINQQIRFMKEKKVGFDKENILFVKARPEVNKKYYAFREELLKSPLIKNVSTTSNIPGKEVFAFRFVPEGHSSENPLMLPLLSVDDNFFGTMSIPLIEGRNFSKEHPSDIRRGFILNETAIRLLGWQKDAIGKKIEVFAPGTTEIMKSGEVIGVIKDFNFESLHHDVKPLVLINDYVSDYYVLKLTKDNLEEGLSYLNSIWSQFSPDWPIEYIFLDKNLEMRYLSEQKIEKVISYFSVIAIVLACLGLYGLSGFTTSQKTKEIGIHKVLGATSLNIVVMLAKNFLLLILISFIISGPVTYWFMNLWLQNFAFHIIPGIEVFTFSLLIASITSLLTVSFHAVKAAFANPVKSLKYE